jgi:hypothetical protein
MECHVTVAARKWCLMSEKDSFVCWKKQEGNFNWTPIGGLSEAWN